MLKFIKMISIELLQLRRGFLLWGSLFLLSVYLYLGTKALDPFNSGEMLQASTYIVMGGSLVGILFGVILAKREESAKFAEVLAAMPGNFLRPFSKLSTLLIVFLFISFIAITKLLLIDKIVNSELIYFWDQTAQYILIYWMMTFFTSGVIGYTMYLVLPSIWVYPILFVIWWFISPYNTTFIFSPFLHWLNQGEVDPFLGYHHYWGLDVSLEAL